LNSILYPHVIVHLALKLGHSVRIGVPPFLHMSFVENLSFGPYDRITAGHMLLPYTYQFIPFWQHKRYLQLKLFLLFVC